MKYIVWAIAIILCFVFGRIMYSPLGPALLAQGSSASVGSERPTVVFGTGSKELRITINLKTVGEREMPTSVLLKKKTPVAAADGSSQTMLAKGDSVTVVERKGLHLVITAGGPLTGLVEIEDTDFTERVIEYRAQRYFGNPIAKNPTPPAPTSTPAPTPTPTPTPPPTPTPTPAPTPTVVVNDPPPAPPEPAPAAALNAEQIVEVMKASVQGGSIKEFTMAQVQGWKAGEEEDVDGETYQTGLAAYKAQTIFGEKTVQAKALIKGGKVTKWIYAKTGMEIR